MAITRLHTWVSGEVLTASDLNAEFNNIIDNLSAAITGTMGDGSVTSPSLAFFTDSDTGLYKIGANALGLAAGGINVFVASEYFQASAFRFPVKTATEAARTAMPGRAYWQSAEGTVHIHTGSAIARVPALVGLQAGDFIAATNPGPQGATSYARGKFSTGLAVSAGGEVTVTPATLAVTASTSQVFTSGTAQTYTTPANVRYIEIEMVGGGGGGAGGNVASDATAGGASTWSGGSLSAGGGAAGALAAPSTGGTSSNGNIANLSGADGHAPCGLATNSAGGAGGNSAMGGGGAPSQAGANAGGAAKANTGGGGAGGGIGAVNNAGGGGAAGGYVRHRIVTPAGTYTYSVGTAGTAGSAGATAGAGGAGAAGIIIVTEFYI